jgi:hypothetical protein
MRRLMSFNINENSHDSLSEENIDNSLSEGVKQCTIKGGPPEVVTALQEDINKLLIEKLDEILKNVKVSIGSEIGTIDTKFEDFVNFPQFTTISFPNKKPLKLLWNEEKNTYDSYDKLSGFRPTWSLVRYNEINIATPIQISEFKKELLSKNICYKMLYDRFDTIKHQIDTGVVRVVLKPQSEETPIKFSMQFVNGKTNNFIRNAQSLTLDDFRNPFSVRLVGESRRERQYGEVWMQGATPLAEFRLFGANIPESWDEIEGDPPKCVCNDIETGEPIEYPCGSPLPERCKDGGIVFDFVVEANKNFEKDSIILTKDAKDKIDVEIVEKWNRIPQHRKEEYLRFLEGKSVEVNAYASIDALSNFPDGGRYAGCSTYGVGKGPRVDYNQCLSEARANAVVAYLKTIANKAFENVNFEAVGKGETNQWSKLVWNQPETKIENGVPQNVKSPYTKDEDNPASVDKLIADRRFEIKFPAYHKDE